jgi:predicted Zn-dependent protease
MKLKYFFLTFISFYLISCGDVNVFPVETDLKIGELYDENILENNSKIVSEEKNKDLYASINKMKEDILTSPQIKYKSNFVWKLKIMDDDSTVNAFCTPGGYIYVYTGLIKFLESEDQLAGVLGHEIAHADLRHSTSQMTKSLGIKAILFFLGIDGGLFTDIAQNLAGLTFSRDHETQADKYSVLYLSSTQYDPKGVKYFFEKMRKKEGENASIQFLSTHPNPENRMEMIEKYWNELDLDTSAPKKKDDYRHILKLVNQIKK